MFIKLFMWLAKKFSKKALKKRAKAAVKRGVKNAASRQAMKVPGLGFLISFMSMMIGGMMIAFGLLLIVVGIPLTLLFGFGLIFITFGIGIILEGLPWAISGVAGIFGELKSSMGQGVHAAQGGDSKMSPAQAQQQQLAQQQAANDPGLSQAVNDPAQQQSSGQSSGGMVNSAVGHAAPTSGTAANSPRTGGDYIKKTG